MTSSSATTRPSVASLLTTDPIDQTTQEGLYVAVLELSNALGITREEAAPRIKQGTIYRGSPREAAAEYFEVLIKESEDGIRSLLPYINLKAFTKDCLESGKLVGTVLGGKSCTINPGTS